MPVATDSLSTAYVPVRAPRGNGLACKGWAQEAAMRMLMNNLDPDVAERPQDLVVYGGTGRAARNWECYHAIVNSLRSLDERRDAAGAVGQAGRHLPHPRLRAARAHLQLQPRRPLVELGEVQRAGEAGPHHVRPDDRRVVDLHRHAGNHSGDVRDVLRLPARSISAASSQAS